MLRRGFGMLKACGIASVVIILLLTQFALAIPRLFFVLLVHIIGKIDQILERLLEAIVPTDLP